MNRNIGTRVVLLLGRAGFARRRAKPALLVLLLVSPSFAQPIYVDYGTNGPPAAGYSAAVPNDPGSIDAWNSLAAPAGGGLINAETGAATGVSINGTGGATAFDQPGTGGDDQQLMDDRMSLGAGGGSYTISGLASGTYSVYTYAWGPDAVSGTRFRVRVNNANSQDQYTTPDGDWPGEFVQGITHTVHTGIVVSAANPTIAINLTFAVGGGSVVLNGLQVIPESSRHTYQGYLRSGGNPSNGTHGMRFRLYGAGSSLLGTFPPTGTVPVFVSNGMFSVGLDFGMNVFSGASRFLEVEVNGQTLNPRQEITPAPYALYARSVPWGGIRGAPTCYSPCGAAGGDLDGSSYPDPVIASNAVTGAKLASDPLSLGRVSAGALYTNGTFVGIGTSTAIGSANLVLHQTTSTFGGMHVNTSSSAGWPFYGYAQAGSIAGYHYIDGSDSNKWKLLLAGAPRLTVATTGLVGIGTTAPAARLDVRGDVKLGSTGQYFAPGGVENLRIIRGRISSVGVVQFGTDFTATRLGTGNYRITFASAFADTPTVTATAIDVSVPQVATVSANSTTSVEIRTWSISGAAADTDFTFIVVGPRLP